MTGVTRPSNSSGAAATQLGEAAHVGAEQRELAREQVPQIDRRGVPGRRAARHQAAAGRERADAAIPGRLADVLDDDVGAAAAGQRAGARCAKSPA